MAPESIPEATPQPEKMVSPQEAAKEAEAMTPTSKVKEKDRQLWRDLAAYWILGLCNNFGYVVMLSAAHDIIKQFEHHDAKEEQAATSGRQCNVLSTGAILLADILPAMLIKLTAPFIPFWVHVRIFFAIAAAVLGFILVGCADSELLALLGVISTSFSAGLGESTFLSYSSRFNKNVVSTWSSGTGGAGIIGSSSYAVLTSLNLSPKTIMFIMLSFPALEALAFWILLRKPSTVPAFTPDYCPSTVIENVEQIKEDEKPLVTLKEKLQYVLTLQKYMIPLLLIYLFEYFINQGLYELVFFENIWLDRHSQYRWLLVDYQIGVFIARSTVNIFAVDRIWLMSLFQFINVGYFLIEVLWLVTPNIWIVFVIVFWEGLLGGGAYVNTFYKMSKELPHARKQFALGVVTQADSFGISMAGLLAIPAHNMICNLPVFERLTKF